jgi:hypothetical protein
LKSSTPKISIGSRIDGAKQASFRSASTTSVMHGPHRAETQCEEQTGQRRDALARRACDQLRLLPRPDEGVLQSAHRGAEEAHRRIAGQHDEERRALCDRRHSVA